MKHRIFYIAAILLAGLAMGACDSDDDSNSSKGFTLENTTMAPTWQMDWNFNQEVPQWQEPQSQSYENWVVILVKIEPELQEYTSKDDLWTTNCVACLVLLLVSMTLILVTIPI